MKSLLLQTLYISVKQYLASVLSPGMHIYKMGCLIDFDKRPKVLHESKHKLTLLASQLVFVLFLLLGWFRVTAVASLGNALAGKFYIFIVGSDG